MAKTVDFTEIKKSDFDEINSAIILTEVKIKQLEAKLQNESLKPMDKKDPRVKQQRELLASVEDLRDKCGDLMEKFRRLLVKTYGSL